MTGASDRARFAEFIPAAWRNRVAACGGVVHEVDGLAVCLTGVPADPFNPTLVERLPDAPEGALAAAAERYEGTGVGFGIDLETDVHAPVRAAAERTGLRLEESRPGMAVAIRDVVTADVPEGLRIERVTDPSILDRIAMVDSLAFGGDAAVTRRFLPDAVLEDPTQRIYAAWIDDDVVAAGESSVVEGVLGVFGIATHPDHRRRGIGAAVTSYLIADRAADADLAVLDASDLGYRVYERLGFRSVSTWEVWVRPT